MFLSITLTLQTTMKQWRFITILCLETAPPIEEPTQPQNEEVAPKTPPQTKAAITEESVTETSEEEKSKPSEADEPKELQNECNTSRAETPHDESDFEDNIIVTVPKPQTHSHNYHDYRDRQNMNGRYNRSSNVNEVETPTNQSQSHQVSSLKLYNLLNSFKHNFLFISIQI